VSEKNNQNNVINLVSVVSVTDFGLSGRLAVN